MNDYYSEMNPKDIWVFSNISTKKQRYYYVPESLQHPAKMPTYLIQRIIKEYTKEGETILDPMAGIGTTLIEAVLLGRNAIGIEYEEKFVKICNENIENIEVFREKIKKMGHAVIFKGDSRNIAKVLGENAIQSGFKQAFSPPYAHESYKTRFDVKRTDKWGNVVDSDNYSEDKKNIGNLSYSVANVIITSPPFSSSLAGSTSDDTNKFKHGSAGKDYCENKNNNEQLGNLDYGKIDSIISSPPFENNVSAVSSNFAGKHPTRARNNFGVYENINYSDNKMDSTNLANLSNQNYLTEMLLVYKSCFLVLKENGLMVLVTKNFTRKGELVRLDLDTIKLCELAGFTFKERKYRKLVSTSFWINNAKKKFFLKNKDKLSDAPFSDFEDCLVFQKV